RLHEGEREHFLDIPTDHAEFGTFALFIMDVAMPRANSEVRSVLDALRKTDLYSDTVPVEISRDEIKKNFGPGWEKLPVEERALLSGLLDRMRIRFRTTSLPAKTGQVCFDMPSFSILRDLFTAMPELEGRQGPQS